MLTSCDHPPYVVCTRCKVPIERQWMIGDDLAHIKFSPDDLALGWRCPVCGRGLAPHISECPCVGRGWMIGDDLAHIKFSPDDDYEPPEA